MKKLIASILFLASVSAFQNLHAQKYFTYDGDVFSILITCDNANTKVTNVEFSENGKWVQFSLHGKTDLEGTKEGGFVFYCKDGKGDYYAVDYYREGDYVIVHSCDSDHNWGDTQWTCYRRAGE